MSELHHTPQPASFVGLTLLSVRAPQVKVTLSQPGCACPLLPLDSHRYMRGNKWHRSERLRLKCSRSLDPNKEVARDKRLFASTRQSWQPNSPARRGCKGESTPAGAGRESQNPDLPAAAAHEEIQVAHLLEKINNNNKKKKKPKPTLTNIRGL